MKKKQRCFVKRFAALVAALVMCAALCVPAFAVADAAEMPSRSDFESHHGSWFVWRVIITPTRHVRAANRSPIGNEI